MAFTDRTKISEYDATAANNINLGTEASPAARLGEYGVDADAEAMRPSDTNGALRELMAHLKAMDAGTSVLTSPKAGQFLLEAISASITATAVDVFVYDTSKDSDGGAWRKRCQHTSWYNETLNTATRGSRREFPAVAVIVAEADTVTIYDGDDPALPMWMVFDGASSGSDLIRFGPIAVDAINGILTVGLNSNFGLTLVNMAADTGYHYTATSNSGLYNGPISSRNDALDFTRNQSAVIVNNTVNDVALTVLPDAPTDPATGLPVPTIAVATDGGVSVIKDDGTVVDSTQTFKMSQVLFDADDTLVFSHRHQIGVIGARVYISTNGVDPTAVTIYGNTSNQIPRLFKSSGSGERFSDVVSLGSDLAVGNNFLNTYLSLFSPDPTTPANGMVAYTTSTYNTGWMNGDIKGAFLADTDDTDLVGSGELVTNGTFDTDTSGWSVGNSNAANTTLASTSSQLVVTSIVNDTNGHWAQQAFSTVVGKTYTVSAEYVGQSNTSVRFARVGGVSITASSGIIASASNPDVGVFNITFVATSTTTYVAVGHGHSAAPATSTWDNISVKLADADRSVNNNGLIVNGTVTRSAVATGAELVAYSGFSASNYLEQPYNSDLDFGTGDFCVMGWVRQDGTIAFKSLVNRVDAATPTLGWQFLLSSDNTPYFYNYTAASGTTNTGKPIPTNSWSFVGVKRSGTTVEVFVNGNAIYTATIGTTLSGNYPLNIGSRQGSVPFTGGSLALLRISATAPTADQIAKIYEDEKFLFQENAACTLYGASDAVTALAHDPDTDLLHVGTSAGRSIFQGLRRVDQTSTPVTTAISAVDGLVVEQ